MRVVIPTGQGGGADRLARVFDDFWGPLLKTSFEYGFFAGAAGQVDYELYLHKRERDGHNLLFGNMGPEMIMYALQKPNTGFPRTTSTSADSTWTTAWSMCGARAPSRGSRTWSLRRKNAQ